MRSLAAILFASVACAGLADQKYDVAAYVWPAYQPESRWAELGIFDKGVGEWQNVQEAVPKWEGHHQPLEPLWGYGNEADPREVERKIDAATAAGVNVFIYDWYWYGKRPFLENALNEGFLKAKNNDKMKFFIMWANHHVNKLWDNRVADKQWGNPTWRSWVDEDEFKQLSKRWIDLYFTRPNYYRIEGKPVLMIYEVGTFVQGVGGLDKAARAIAGLREACVKAGLGGLHLMACDFGLSAEQVKALGVDSSTIYNFVHWSSPGGNPDYADWAAKGAERFDAAKATLGLRAYFAHASVGWDTNPRYPKSSVQATVINSTPEKFETVLRRAKDWCDANTPEGMPRLITVNSWNEWTEGSYLEPDKRSGYGYIDAVRRVFNPTPLLAHAPETWFHIIDGNASKEGIAADIQAIAEAGISGIQFFHGGWGGDVWPGVKEPIPCLSEKWVELVKFAETECHKRGLTFKMQNCPGWSMSGGPWITPDKAMRRLVAFEPGKKPTFDEDDDYHEIGTVTFPAPDESRDGELLRVFPNPQQLCHAWAYEPKTNLWGRPCPPGAWQDSVPMTFAKHGASRLDMWEAKAGWGLRRFEMSTNAAPVKTVGTKTLVFGHVNAKRRNAPAPKEATGWECDKMDPRGFEANWNGYLGKLIKAGVKIDGTLVDSWECGCQTWTWKMEEEFEKRNGYKLRPWLPALFGYVLRSEAETEKFLLDWRNTCSRLIEENYYGTIARLAHENGMSVQYETAFGDVIPGDILRYWKYADEPMCEFWSPFDNEKGFVGSHDFKAVRPCVSAAHIYGKKRVSAEAFTSFQLSYDETFQELKENANRHFARGVTHLVFHTYTHNPVVTGQTVVASMQGTIGTPFNRIQPWWPYMREFTRYLESCCRMLERMGHPVVDILWYLGDDVNHKPSERDDLFNNQYKYDYCNNDALMTRVDVKDGRLVFPDGMSYRVLWIPKGTFLLPATEAKLAELEKKGARVIRGELKPDWPPDFEILSGKGDLYWYHRGNGTYFIAARENGFDGKVRMRVPSGVGGIPAVKTLHLARGESVFLMVGGCTYMVYDPARWNSSEAAQRSMVGEEMAFETQTLKCLNAQLPGWTEDSTTKTYAFAFERPKGEAVFLDLGKVCHWATIKVNGEDPARFWREPNRLWCEPYRYDITKFLKDGENVIEVEVTSTLHNTLVREASLPPSERKTWVLGGPEADAPLADAGLYGPVTLKVVK